MTPQSGQRCFNQTPFTEALRDAIKPPTAFTTRACHNLRPTPSPTHSPTRHAYLTTVVFLTIPKRPCSRRCRWRQSTFGRRVMLVYLTVATSDEQLKETHMADECGRTEGEGAKLRELGGGGVECP